MQFDAQHPVALFCNGYGDSVLSLPALRALDSVFEGRWTLILDSYVDYLLYSELHAKKVAVAFSTGKQGKDFDREAVLAAIPACDLFIGMVPWRSPKLLHLMKSLQPRNSLGFFSEYTSQLPLDFSKHTSHLTFDVVHALDPAQRLDDYCDPPKLPDHARARARALLGKFPAGLSFLTVHADTLDDKMWPPERFRAVLDRFLERHSHVVAILLGTRDQSLDDIQNGDRVVPCYGLPLEVSMAVVQESNLFLGIDSCLLHVADFCRVPGIGLFGATNANEFGFLLGPHRHVVGDGMDAITVEAVFDAMNELCEETQCLSLLQPTT